MDGSQAPIVSGAAPAPISSGTGDVILTPVSGPGVSGPRRGVIVGIVVGVLAVVLMVVLGLWAGGVLGGGNSGAAVTSFNNLKQYIEDGTGFDAKLEEETGSDLIYAVRISGDIAENIKIYYDGLEEKSNSFIDEIGSVVDTDTLTDYLEELRIMKNAVNYRAVGEGLLSSYEGGGSKLAQQYFDDNIACGRDVLLSGLCDYEEDYYETLLERHEIYKRAGCYAGKNYDIACAMEAYDDESFAELTDVETWMRYFLWEILSEARMEDMSSEILRMDAVVLEEIKNA